MQNIYGYGKSGCRHVIMFFSLVHWEIRINRIMCNKCCFRSENPQHRLVVHELKGAWTSSNRDVAFALLDSFVKTQVFFNSYCSKLWIV